MSAAAAAAARKVALVTGGAGFLGFHLTSRLLTDGYFVISVDNFCTGHKNNVSAFHGNQNYFFLQHDVSLPIPRDAHELMSEVCLLPPPPPPPTALLLLPLTCRLAAGV
jgi:UDP-glucuronate decarboxylase